MNLKNGLYSELALNIKQNNSRIYIYGAGMIGRMIVPYMIETYGLQSYVECYIDADVRKAGQKINVGSSSFEIRTPDILDSIPNNSVILLTNSNFIPIINYMEQISALNDTDVYIIPIMQKSEQRPSIPRIIHYCWFGGGDIPPFLRKCIESWSLICPDYEIRRWDETNYDVNRHAYTREAYEHKKYSFVSDVARLDILYECGGIYLDTDVKLLKSYNELLFNTGFVGVEKWGNINSGGGIGAVPHHPMIKEMLEYRLKSHFVLEDGSLNTETNGCYETVPFIEHGMRIDNTLQIINDMTVYPSEVFHPYDYISDEEEIMDSTRSIHYFYGGWLTDSDRSARTGTRDSYKAILDRMKS
ncbi:MAG: hypothetical protein K5662_07610 [Lachnospiraceae bacterium]|nr:hypothetical protein [Lachnospiraceae bacterium]